MKSLKTITMLTALLAIGCLGTVAQAGVILQPSAASTDMGKVAGLPVEFRPTNVINQSGLSQGYTSLVDDFDDYLATAPSHDSESSSAVWTCEWRNNTGNFDLDLGGTYMVRALALWTRWDYQYPKKINLFGDDDGDFSDAVALGSYTSSHPGSGTNTLHEVFAFTPEPTASSGSKL